MGDLAAAAYAAGGLSGPYLEVVRDVALRAAPGPVLVAEREGDLVGTVTVCPPGSSHAEIGRPGEVEFRFLAVSVHAQGSGVGAELARAVIVHGASIGAERVVCCVLLGNEPAHALYRRLGFNRAPDRDWSPVPGIELHAYELELPTTPSRARGTSAR